MSAKLTPLSAALDIAPRAFAATPTHQVRITARLLVVTAGAWASQ